MKQWNENANHYGFVFFIFACSIFIYKRESRTKSMQIKRIVSFRVSTSTKMDLKFLSFFAILIQLLVFLTVSVKSNPIVPPVSQVSLRNIHFLTLGWKCCYCFSMDKLNSRDGPSNVVWSLAKWAIFCAILIGAEKSTCKLCRMINVSSASKAKWNIENHGRKWRASTA